MRLTKDLVGENVIASVGSWWEADFGEVRGSACTTAGDDWNGHCLADCVDQFQVETLKDCLSGGQWRGHVYLALAVHVNAVEEDFTGTKLFDCFAEFNSADVTHFTTALHSALPPAITFPRRT